MPQSETPLSIDDLFGENQGQAFELGFSSELISRRNSHLGALFTTERAVFYVQILYRMLLFKRDHELEPLYEDIYRAVKNAQEQCADNSEYSGQQFLADMRQLADWKLVRFRIEKERLRGYRDNRKRKFRYALEPEAAALLQWLESRLLGELEDRGSDARDLLEEVCGSLNELLRLLNTFPKDEEKQADHARRILFQLFKLDDLTQAISANLIEFNGRLLHFLVHRYEIELVRRLLAELDSYVESFLNQIYKLGQEIIPLTEKLLLPRNAEKLSNCFQLMEAERLQAPHFLQGDAMTGRRVIPERLHRFFLENGGLDQLHRRFGRSVIQVWQKLRSHLRELERKNNRLEDLRSRIREIATLNEERVPEQFLGQLLAPAAICCDPNYWDDHEKADPPEPRRQAASKKSVPRVYLKPKQRADKPVQTMDEAKLERLARWLQNKVLTDGGECSLVSQGRYDEEQDFNKIMELAMAGYLDSGRRLQRINYSLREGQGQTSVEVASQKLTFLEMEARKWT